MPKKKTTTDVSVVENKLKQSAEPISLISPQGLKTQIQLETDKRRLLTKFISDHLKDGTDFGKIHIYKTCQFHKTPWLCKNTYHFSKNTLFKPGAEKFSSLFKLRSAFRRDKDTWEMLGSPAGTICYVCELYTAKDVLTGEGRGAASVAEKGNPNTAIKIAKKRAFVDAVLSTGALSDFFTQDLEDMKESEPDTDEIVSVVVSYDEPKKEEVKKEVPLKTKIANLMYLLDMDITKMTGDDAKNHIKALTGLEVEELNYPEIISRLETILKEREENIK